MVPVQNPPGGSHAGPLPGLLPPGDLKAHVQVVADHRGLGAGVGLLGQAVHLLEEPALHLLVQPALQNPVSVLGQLAVLVLPQLLLQKAYLLPDNVVPLDLPHLLADLALQLLLAGEDLRLPGQQLVDLPQAGHGADLLQNGLLILVAEHDVLGDEVCQVTGVPVVHHGGGHLLPQAGGQGGVLGKVGVGLAQKSLQLGLGNSRAPLRHGLHVALEVGLGLPQPPQAGAAPALHHHPDRGLPHPENLADHRHRAHREQVARAGLAGSDLPLGHQEDVLVPLHGPLQGADGDLPLHIKAEDAAGEDGQPPQGQHRHVYRGILKHIHLPGSPFPGGSAGRDAQYRQSA